MKCWKYLAITFVCISLALLSYGCPYDSQFPLGPASESKIDKSLIGAWQIAPGKGRSGGAVLIYPFNETEFIIVLQSCPVKKNSNMVCCTRLLDNSGDETLYQQGGTDHEQSIHDLLGDIEAVSEIPF
jgi:hypothetical protein